MATKLRASYRRQGSSGIGLATVHLARREGGEVIICSGNEKRLKIATGKLAQWRSSPTWPTTGALTTCLIVTDRSIT